METPLGTLRDLDLSNHEVCARVLALDKHQLVEGLVFESYFDQYLLSLTDASGAKVQLVDVDTAVVQLPYNEGLGAFVWARSRGPGLGRYLEALARQMRVWLIEYTDGDFFAAPFVNGQLQTPGRPLQNVAADVAHSTLPRFQEIETGVRNQLRMNQSFWGYLSERHGRQLGFNVVLPRIFLNWGIQPWFRQLWNVDRIFLYGDQLWHFEIKHKYPMKSRTGLSFGINDGELRLMQHLIGCGLRSMHTLIVKPYWDNSFGSMYLQNDLKARGRAAVIGREMSCTDIEAALKGIGGKSGAHTSFSGRSNVSFRSFSASGFHRFGLLGDDYQEVARRIFAHMVSGDQPKCEDSDLLRLQMPIPHNAD